KREGENVIIPIMEDKEDNKICAVGCCVIRKAYINGEVKRTGYLTGLKVLPEYQRRMPHIGHAYDYLYQQTKEQVDVYYTTILKENVLAQKILEKKRKGMPIYQYMGDYTVYCFKTGAKQKAKHYIFEKGNLMGVEKFYDAQLKNYNFAPVGSDVLGLNEQEIYTLRDAAGHVIAACTLWNQQSYKQYIITGYHGIYNVLKKLPLKILGYPNLPKENMPVNYASVTMLCVKDNNRDLAEYFIKKVAQSSVRHDFLMIGLYENHPLKAIFNKIKHIKYESKVYTVHFNDLTLTLDNRTIDLEVGLL
ncbi:MAG: hypothetical protein ACOH15_12110, partial [Acetobacterium sp.]